MRSTQRAGDAASGSH